MFSAVEAIEEFEDALLRLDDGRYGTCEACGGSIPTDRLEVIPQARFCASCPAPAGTRRRTRRARHPSAIRFEHVNDDRLR
jgi:RNA polymerase-binding transcription factor DksA